MFKLTGFMMIAVLTFSLSGVSSITYADQGGGGHGQGQGKGHGGGKGYGHSKGHGHGKKSHASVARFSDTDRTKIVNFINANPLAVPVTTLPPGIAKNLARGKPLPPGIAKVFLPSGVLSTLPVYPGYQYRVVGNDVVLVDPTTGIVADILANVLK